MTTPTLLSDVEYQEAARILSNMHPVQSFYRAKEKLDELMESEGLAYKDLPTSNALTGEQFDHLKHEIESKYALETSETSRKDKVSIVLKPIECRPLGIIVLVFEERRSGYMWMSGFFSDGLSSEGSVISRELFSVLRDLRNEKGEVSHEDFQKELNAFLFKLFLVRSYHRRDVKQQKEAHSLIKVGDFFAGTESGEFYRVLKKTKVFVTLQELPRIKRNKCDYDEAEHKLYSPYRSFRGLSDTEPSVYYSADLLTPPTRKPFSKKVTPAGSVFLHKGACPDTMRYALLEKIPSGNAVWGGHLPYGMEDIEEKTEMCELRDRKSEELANVFLSDIEDDSDAVESSAADKVHALAMDKRARMRSYAAESSILSLRDQCRLARDKSVNVRKALFSNSNLHDKVRCILALDSREEVRRELTFTLGISPSEELLGMLSEDPIEEVRHMLAENLSSCYMTDDAIKDNIFLKIYAAASSEDQSKMLGFDSVPATFTAEIIKEGERSMVFSLLRNRRLKPEFFQDIYELGIPGIERYVANHPNCPTAIISEYIEKKKGPIEQGIYGNKNTPVSFLEKAASRGNLAFENMLGLVYNKSLTPDAVASLKKHGRKNTDLMDAVCRLEEKKHYSFLK